MNRYVICFVSILAIQAALAQDTPENKFSYISTTEGLSDPSAQDVTKDVNGIIWIATRNGLNKYDGENITHFNIQDGLPNQYVFRVIQDPNDSVLWIGTKGGLCSFDLYSNTFRQYQITDSIQPHVPDLAFDNQQNLWLATATGLAKYTNGKFTLYKSDSSNQHSILDDYAMSLLPVGDSIFVGTYYGLNVFLPEEKKFKHRYNDSAEIFQAVDYYVQKIKQRKNGEIWFSAFEEDLGGIVYRYTPEGILSRYQHNPPDPKSLNFNFSVLALEEDKKERLWVGTNGGGISIFNDEEDNFYHIPHDPKIANGLNDFDIWDLYCDDQNIMWVSTDGGGVNKHHHADSRFKTLENNPFDSESIRSSLIMTFEDTKDHLWVGTNALNGISRLEKFTGKFYNIPFDDSPETSLLDNTVYDLEIVDNNLWVATHIGGISVMNLQTEKFQHLIDIEQNSHFLYNATTTLLPLGNTMYLANDNGLGRFSFSDYLIETLPIPEINKTIGINHMAEKDEEIWLATPLGIFIYSIKNESYIEINKNIAQLTDITFIFHNDKTWIGTVNGLWIYNEQKNDLQQVVNMEDRSIQGIVSDGKTIWATTTNGLYQLSLEAQVLRKFGINDGLKSNYFNLRAISLGADNKIYLGGNEGITFFSPSKMEFLKKTVAPMYSTIAILDGNKINKKPIEEDNIALDYDESTFALDFYVPDYINPESLHYKYRILGLSDQYFSLHGESEINVTDLSPGTYNIETYTTNIDGVWSAPSTVTVRIKPPFWASWYAFVTYGLAFVSLFFARERYRKEEQKRLEKIISERTQEVREQAEEIKKLDKVKTRFFSNISHEFRTPLTLIQGPIASVLQGKVHDEIAVKKNLEVATRNVDNLRNLIDELLEFNKIDFGVVDIHYVPVLLADYLQEFSENYSTLIADKNLRWALDTDLDHSLKLNLPIDKVEKILHNLLSNAIKHSPTGGQVTLDISYANKTLIIKVSDEGKGIAVEEQEKIFERFYQASEGKLMPHSSGIGLAYVKEITEALGGSIKVISDTTSGTTFLFTLTAEKAVQISEEITQEIEELEGSMPYTYPNNKILLTEDNEEMANYIKQVLGDEFIVEWAENGKEALTKLESFDADLIITDIMMPIMTGLELLENLKANDRYKYKSVIMLTAKSSQETRLDALSFGLDDYLTKPFNPTELEYRVKNLLRNQYERQQAKGDDDLPTSQDPLIATLISEIENNLNNRNFGVLDLANKAAVSDRQLSRIIKRSIGLSPALLIREVKLKSAKEFLEQKRFRTLSEVTH
ncbi:MAG: response regulator, partial [Cyclobacteriaceae bacterium]